MDKDFIIKILDKLSRDIDFIRCNVGYIKDYISRDGIPVEKIKFVDNFTFTPSLRTGEYVNVSFPLGKPTNFKDLLNLMNGRKEEYAKENGVFGYIDTPIKDLDDLRELRDILTHAINSIEKGDDNG